MKFSHSFKKIFSPEVLKSNLLVEDPDLLVARGKGFVIDRLGSLLPYGHEVEAGLFTIMDDKRLAIESIGYTLEVTPQTGATPEMASQLTSLFSTDLPTATGIQVTLFAEPDIKWATNAYEASRTPDFLAPPKKKEIVKTLTHLAHERVRYLKKGLSHPLSKGSHFRVRHFRAWVSIAIPLGDKDLFVAIEKAKKERDRHITLLKSQYLYSHTWNSLDLYRTLRTILNAQKSPEELKTKAKPSAWDSLSHGLINPDTRAVIKEEGVKLSSSNKEPVLLTGLSVSGYPSDYALALTSRFIGHKAHDIPCPFLVTCAVSMPDFEKTRSKANIMAARAKQIADSELARYLPYLKIRTMMDSSPAAMQKAIETFGSAEAAQNALFHSASARRYFAQQLHQSMDQSDWNNNTPQPLSTVGIDTMARPYRESFETEKFNQFDQTRQANNLDYQISKQSSIGDKEISDLPRTSAVTNSVNNFRESMKADKTQLQDSLLTERGTTLSAKAVYEEKQSGVPTVFTNAYLGGALYSSPHEYKDQLNEKANSESFRKAMQEIGEQDKAELSEVERSAQK